MRRFKSHVQVFALVLSACLLCWGVASAKGKPGGGGGGGGPSFEIIPLDDAGGAVHNGAAKDINNARQAVGYVDDASGPGRYAAYWSISELNGQIQSTLSLLAGDGAAYGINDVGEIAGTGDDASGNPVGLYWSSASALPVELPPLTGHDASNALAINDDGVICGRSGILGAGMQYSRAVAWRVNWVEGVPVVFGPVELPGPVDGSSAVDLTDNDGDGLAEVAGYYEAAQGGAVVWTVASLTDGSLVATGPTVLDGNGIATGINNSGIACGYNGQLAVLWDGVSTNTLQRPTKGKNAAPWTRAFDISDTGVIVGRGGPGTIDARAVVWPSADGAMMYLDSFLGSNSPLLGLESANAVNDSGEIVGTGWNGAYVAIPR